MLRALAGRRPGAVLQNKMALAAPCLLRWAASEDGPRGPVVSIDRSGLFNQPPHSHEPAAGKEPETELAKQLKALIRFRGGPLTVAEYMSEALTNASAGYYMRRDVFGRSGDFITSPEVSQLFGEAVGVWCALQWQALGSPARLRLVELGPGRGTLMADLLRGTATLRCFASALEVHLVEVSPAMRATQRKTLQCDDASDSASAEAEAEAVGRSGLTGAQVHWWPSLEAVPSDGPTLFIAHEFLDALPAHQFQRTERGWCERLVDIAPPASPLHLGLVLSPGATPASQLLLPRRLAGLPAAAREELQELEVSPQCMATAEALAGRIASQGGAALIVDYGRDGPYGASLQAIRRHQLVHFLATPGDADLSCRVDFGALRQAVEQSGAAAAAHGPLPQAHFLAAMGIEARLDALLAAAKGLEQQNALVEGFNRLVGGSEKDGDEGMGFTYLVMAITGSGQPPPVPFPGSGVSVQ